MSALKTKGHDLPPGIRRRHARSCPAVKSDDLDVCTCRPSYQAQAGPRTDRQTATHRTLGAAKTWKRDTEKAYEAGERTGEQAPRFRAFADEWLVDAEAGVILARGDVPFKASTLREYRSALDRHIYPVFGDTRLDRITRGSINDFIRALMRKGLAAQTVKNTVMPLRTVLRHAIDVEAIAANPSTRIRVPAGSGKRLRFLTPTEIEPLLGALESADRALWATAIYAGLRRGELMALRWMDVDLARGIIRVGLAYDPGSKTMTATKSAAGDREVPIVGALRDYLLAHRQRAGGRPRGLVFARGALGGVCRGAARTEPFSDQTVGTRAKKAWIAAGINPVTLHDCRHTFASLMIAAMAASGSFNPKTLQTMLGHTSIQLTYDRYGHLFPGAQAEAIRQLDAYLESEAARQPQPVADVLRAVDVLVAALDGTSDDAAVPEVTRAVQAGQTWLAGQPALPSVAPGPRGLHGDQVGVCRRGDRSIR